MSDLKFMKNVLVLKMQFYFWLKIYLCYITVFPLKFSSLDFFFTKM